MILRATNEEKPMRLSQTEILSHAEARHFVRRSIDKTEALNSRGAFVAVDESGAPVSASRMDGVGGFALQLSRAKAHSAATLREPSAVIFDRLENRPLGLFLGYQDIARDKFFIGQGAMLINKNEVTIGALATGAGIGPFVKIEGVTPEQLIVAGKPANLEDLIICYALAEAYQSQHGDDTDRWLKAYGKPASEFGVGTGFEEAPAAQDQVMLDGAIKLADAALDVARQQGTPISVVITDRLGDQIQLDRMDEAAPMTPDMAAALAVTAINFRCLSSETEQYMQRHSGLGNIDRTVPYRQFYIAGGVPIFINQDLVGAIGIVGPEPKICEETAIAAVISCGGSTSGN